MKRTIAATFVIAFVTSLVLCVAPGAAAEDKPCSNASLNGAFAYTNTGFIVAPPPLAGPFAGVGTQTFDGRGNTSASATVSQNGNILRVTITGTYTVNPDCTGSMTLLVSPVNVTSHVDFVIVRGGAEFRAINTDPGAAITTVGKKQFPEDKRKE
jgi:hypothetical protein